MGSQIGKLVVVVRGAYTGLRGVVETHVAPKLLEIALSEKALERAFAMHDEYSERQEKLNKPPPPTSLFLSWEGKGGSIIVDECDVEFITP